MDVHSSVGGVGSVDLVVRGDRFPRKCRAFGTHSPADDLRFQPANFFQLVPGAYNRVGLQVIPRIVGNRSSVNHRKEISIRYLFNLPLILFLYRQRDTDGFK
jgi:hypothetical protein